MLFCYVTDVWEITRRMHLLILNMNTKALKKYKELKEAMIEIKSEKQQKQVAPEAKKLTPKNGKASQKDYDGIQIRGIPESEATDARSRQTKIC